MASPVNLPRAPGVSEDRRVSCRAEDSHAPAVFQDRASLRDFSASSNRADQFGFEKYDLVVNPTSVPGEAAGR